MLRLVRRRDNAALIAPEGGGLVLLVSLLLASVAPIPAGVFLQPGYGMMMKVIRHAVLALTFVLPCVAQAETKEEWIALGARVHGGFGPFIPVGIRIGLDAMQRLNADRHDVTVLYYDGGLPPCPCVADGIMIATQATPGQKTLVMSSEKAPAEYMAVVVVKSRKTGEVLRYTIAKEWHPKILSWRSDLDPSGRYDAGMNAEGLFAVEPTRWPDGIDAR